MALETGTYIDSLVATNPTFSDPVSAGDDHIRLIKATIKNTFPNVSGAVTATHTELNYCDGVTSNIQTQIDNASEFDSGTRMLFWSSSAPTGWTQNTTHNDKALRIVSGTAGGSGGTHALTSPPSTSHNHGDNFAVANHTLSNSRIPSHSHGLKQFAAGGGNYGIVADVNGLNTQQNSNLNTNNTGSGGSHNHGINGSVSSGSITAFAPQYFDILAATKD